MSVGATASVPMFSLNGCSGVLNRMCSTVLTVNKAQQLLQGLQAVGDEGQQLTACIEMCQVSNIHRYGGAVFCVSCMSHLENREGKQEFCNQKCMVPTPVHYGTTLRGFVVQALFSFSVFLACTSKTGRMGNLTHKTHEVQNNSFSARILFSGGAVLNGGAGYLLAKK